MGTDAMMQFIGVVNGVKYYFAKEGIFTEPGIKFWDGEKHIDLIQRIAALESALAAAEADAERLRELLDKSDWQNQPNRNPASRGAYEFYINEEWTGIASAAIGKDVGSVATLRKHRLDPDDDRVRIRLVRDDDALLAEAAALREELDRVRTEEGRADAYWGEKEDRIRAEQQRDAAIYALEDMKSYFQGAALADTHEHRKLYAMISVALEAAGRTGNHRHDYPTNDQRKG